jgi:ubiquinone/menaquinone biosynthesis C-methylase UbiE
LRDEINAYWSERAATFDEQVGHEIRGEAERRAWHALILRHLGRGEGRAALDLATGTAVIAHLMDDLGFRVTGLDWSEAMLACARAKAAARGRRIDFILGDAEATMLPDASVDVVVTRHLVWTLVDPPAAFAEWHRVLRPGGRLFVVDGDFVTPTVIARLQSLIARVRRVASAEDRMRETHRSILARVPFSHGARAEEVAALLAAAGFGAITVDRRLGAIHRAQAPHLGLLRSLDRRLQHRYAISATKAG